MGKTIEPKTAQTPKETVQQTLDRLVGEQGAKPMNIAEFERLWPEDFDPDEFNRWLGNERRERRALSENRRQRQE